MITFHTIDIEGVIVVRFMNYQQITLIRLRFTPFHHQWLGTRLSRACQSSQTLYCSIHLEGGGECSRVAPGAKRSGYLNNLHGQFVHRVV